MDDVAIVTAEPVKPVTAKPAGTTTPPKKVRPAGTIANFFYMMPLALVVLGLAYWLGVRLADYTTFPIFTIHSYKTLGAIAMLYLMMHIVMRSIVYGTMFGVLMLLGMYNTWFTDVWRNLSTNLADVIPIMQAAWSNREIPFGVMMSTLLTVLLVIAGVLGFIVSLFCKYFFETVFGAYWSDGRRTAFIAAVVIMVSVHAGFGLWRSNEGATDRIVWKILDKYQPLSEFVTKIPSGVQFDNERLWVYGPDRVQAIEASTGKVLGSRDLQPTLLGPTWSRLKQPLLPTADGMAMLDRDVAGNPKVTRFPEKITVPILQTEPGTASTSAATAAVPLLFRPDVREGFALVRFDHGYWAAYNTADNNLLWFKAIDAARKVDRYDLENFTAAPYIVSIGDVIVFSCLNGRLSAVRANSGDAAWEFQPPPEAAKTKGVPQRAMLSRSGDRLIAAYPSGFLIVLNGANGATLHAHKIIDRSGSARYAPATEAVVHGDDAYLFTNDGAFLRVRLDGAEVLKEEPLFRDRPPLMPVGFSLTDGFAGFRDQFFKLDFGPSAPTTAHNFNDHVVSTHPVFSGDCVYFGTQDGWVFCLHRRSFDEKYRVHLAGELGPDALQIVPAGLLARTRSGSLYCLKPWQGE